MTFSAQIIRPRLRSTTQSARQKSRWVLPSLIALAVVAAVTASLASTDTTVRAEAPPPAPHTTGCTELQPITLTAGTTGASNTTQESTPNGCKLTATIGPAPDRYYSSPDSSPKPCQATFAPSPIGTTGVRVDVTTTGDCDGTTISWESTPPTPQVPHSAVQGAGGASGATGNSGGYTAAFAKIVGEDPIGLDMFYNKSHVAWGYTSTTVNAGTHYPSDWVWSGAFWNVQSRHSSLTKQGGTSYQGYNRVKFKAFQLTQADTKTTLAAKPGGAFSCAFSIDWTLKTLGMSSYTECDTQ